MQMSGPNGWGQPTDWAQAKQTIQTAYDGGIRLFDSAGFYGPDVALRLLKDVIPADSTVKVSTKVGIQRQDAKRWTVDASAQAIQTQVEQDLVTLGRERLDMVLLRLGDGRFLPRDPRPLAESLDALLALQTAGKIDQIGISQATLADVQQAHADAGIQMVENPFNVLQADDEVLSFCQAMQLRYVAYSPLAGGQLIKRPKAILLEIAERHQATTAQVVLAWLLQRSPIIEPIVGTSNPQHVQEALAAQHIKLSAVERAQLAQFM
jgi:pyridoxine 4-dehydrogenase